VDTSETGMKYDSWHAQMSAAGRVRDPLVFPWYRSAFNHIKDYPRGKLLEIGCGRGEFALWLGETSPLLNITAVDFSESAVAIAKGYQSEVDADVRFLLDDAQALSFPPNSFDYVVSCECMEHVPQPQQMAKELYRVLKPGGRFCITTENYLNGMLLAWAQSLVTGKPFNSGSGVQPHENFFFFWHVLKYLRSSGLIVDKTESCHYQWLLLPRVDPAKLRTTQFSAAWLRFLAKPFGRHFSFFGRKPNP
jgi:SAM-dependent methyltransferase